MKGVETRFIKKCQVPHTQRADRFLKKKRRICLLYPNFASKCQRGERQDWIGTIRKEYTEFRLRSLHSELLAVTDLVNVLTLLSIIYLFSSWEEL